jgi:hypothetical protein
MAYMSDIVTHYMSCLQQSLIDHFLKIFITYCKLIRYNFWHDGCSIKN